MKLFKYSFLLAVIFIFSTAPVLAQETGGVKGKVRTVKGDGIEGVIVSARQENAEIKSVKSGGGGKFILSGLKPGLYNIVFDKDGFSPGIKYNVEIKKNSTRDLGDRLILAVDQGTQIILKGSVFNQYDRSVGGAKVEVEKILSDGSTEKISSGYTNISGEFTFRFSEGAAKIRVIASAKGSTASLDRQTSLGLCLRQNS